MNIDGVPSRTIGLEPDGWSVRILDQTRLPWAVAWVRLTTLAEAAHAIRAMLVRGAPLIGVTAAYGVALALRADPSTAGLDAAIAALRATRPTAVNLGWALDRMRAALHNLPAGARVAAGYATAAMIAEDDVATCRRIGEHGAPLIAAARKPDGAPVNILTHCNAGWLATVDHGTALSPIYQAHDAGIPVHVWVDETRPRNQGAALTAWELGQHGVPHTVIADNAGGHLMQRGQVDLCVVGADRVARNGDAANKIGTYLKALAAHDNGVPFWVAIPHSTIDWTIADGVRDIPIEERDAAEVTDLQGQLPDGGIATFRVAAPGSPAANPAFDVTPARLLTGLITERGCCPASEAGLRKIYPEIE